MILVRHPIVEAAAVFSVEASAVRDGASLALTFVLAGDLARLAIPALAAPSRADELWRHTCFEAFVRPGAGEAYLELNFAPSTRWAAYRFTGHRQGMAPAELAPPRIDVATSGDRLTLVGKIDLSPLAGFAVAPWRLALTAVIEDATGAMSYWALAHPKSRPDFHHASGFVLSLRPP